MRTFLKILGAIVLVGLVLGYFFRDELQFFAMRTAMKPADSFASTTPPAAPTYSNTTHWAALPDRKDNADVVPVGEFQDKQANAAVDVFFVHPTTYYSSDSWNQPLDHEEANQFTDDMVLKNQASVFNGCCAIYAPRYRQATLYAFFDLENGGQAAIDFAYQDVKQAFKYFLENHSIGRPFILAGHSQGGTHLDRLMTEEINGTPLQSRMVAAYPIGFSIDGSNGIPICNTPDQVGCQVTWNSVAPDAPSFADTSTDICVNPLTWKTDGTRAEFDANPGAVTFSEDVTANPGSPEPAATDAQCVNGRLHITEVRSPNYSTQMFGEGNYHIYDFSFFNLSIRENATARVAAYLKRVE